MLLSSWVADADTLEPVGMIEWPSEAFVGLSGLEVSGDGLKFFAVSDRGWFLSGEFERTKDQISGIKLEKFLPILGNDGLPVAARRVGDWSDAEGWLLLLPAHICRSNSLKLPIVSASFWALI